MCRGIYYDANETSNIIKQNHSVTCQRTRPNSLARSGVFPPPCPPNSMLHTNNQPTTAVTRQVHIAGLPLTHRQWRPTHLTGFHCHSHFSQPTGRLTAPAPRCGTAPPCPPSPGACSACVTPRESCWAVGPPCGTPPSRPSAPCRRPRQVGQPVCLLSRGRGSLLSTLFCDASWQADCVRATPL